MKISVITPVFNCSRYIADAIESVLLQNCRDFEHVVVDGGSTDGTLDILKKYKHLKWISEPDNGQSDAMNKGFKMSTGDIVVYLNADDYFLHDAFTAVLPCFEQGANFVVGKILVMKYDGTQWINDAMVSHEAMLRHWKRQSFCVNPVGYFYRREVQESVNGFNVENHFAMDLEFLLDCSKKYSFTKIDNAPLLGVFRNIRNTKTESIKAGMSHYWSEENFSFINRFLSEMPEEYSRKFIKERKRGYKTRIISDKLEQPNIPSLVYFCLRAKLFFLSENRISSGINYFFGK